jgi:hypothetical protein
MLNDNFLNSKLTDGLFDIKHALEKRYQLKMIIERLKISPSVNQSKFSGHDKARNLYSFSEIKNYVINVQYILIESNKSEILEEIKDYCYISLEEFIHTPESILNKAKINTESEPWNLMELAIISQNDAEIDAEKSSIYSNALISSDRDVRYWGIISLATIRMYFEQFITKITNISQNDEDNDVKQVALDMLEKWHQKEIVK